MNASGNAKPLALVVEDEKEISNLLKASLNEIGFDALEFHDGKLALDYLQNNDSNLYKLIILETKDNS